MERIPIQIPQVKAQRSLFGVTARPRLEVRMLVRALKLQLAPGETLVTALNALVTSKWASQVVNGQTVLSTVEAGGSVTFTFDRAYTPAELATMAEEALEWINTLADPENPPLDVPRYNRLHPTFHKAVL